MAPAVGVERRRVQAGPAGMVFGGQKVPAGTLGANEGTNGAGTLWWRTGAGRSRTSRRSGPARLEGTGLEGERSVGAAQGRSQETEAGGAVACGNDGDDQMDRGAAPHGHLDLSQSPTVLEAAGKRTMRFENTTILRTDPFTETGSGHRQPKLETPIVLLQRRIGLCWEATRAPAEACKQQKGRAVFDQKAVPAPSFLLEQQKSEKSRFLDLSGGLRSLISFFPAFSVTAHPSLEFNDPAVWRHGATPTLPSVSRRCAIKPAKIQRYGRRSTFGGRRRFDTLGVLGR